MAYDGTDPTLLDASALGDGQDDTLPPDTFVANVLWNLTQYCAQEPRTICVSPIIDNAADKTTAQGVRPFAMVGGHISFWRGVVEILPGWTGFRVWIAYHAMAASAEFAGADDTTEVTLRLSLEGVATATYVLDTTRVADVPELALEAFDLVWEPTEYGGATRRRYLDISIQSRPAKTTADTTSLARLGARTIYDAAPSSPEFFLDGTSGNPTTDSLEVMAAEYARGNDGAQLYDMIGVESTAGKFGDGSSEAYVVQDVPVWHSSDETVALRELSFIAPRAIALEPVVGKTSAGELTKAALRPNIALRGATTGIQARAALTLLTRPRLVASGPRGTLRAADATYTALGYRRGWPTILGDDDETALWSETVYLTTENPELVITQWIVCIQNDSSDNFKDRDGKKKQEGESKPGKAKWDFRVSIEQMDDVAGAGADWDVDVIEYGSTEMTQILDLHPSGRDILSHPPIARTMAHLWQGGDLAYKEGGLLSDYGDDAYVQLVTIRVKMADTFSAAKAGLYPGDPTRPFRVTLYAEHDPDSPRNDYLHHKMPGALTPVEGGIQLIGGQYTVTEVPDPEEVRGDIVPENFLPDHVVRAADWEALRERLEWHYSRLGGVIGGVNFDPPFETTSDVYTTTDEGAGGINLDTWCGIWVPQRITPQGTYVLDVQGHLQNAILEVKIDRWDGRMSSGTYTDTVTLVGGSNSYLLTDQIILDEADAHVSGDTANDIAPFLVTVRALRTFPAGPTGYIWQFGSRERWFAPYYFEDSVSFDVSMDITALNSLGYTDTVSFDIEGTMVATDTFTEPYPVIEEVTRTTKTSNTTSHGVAMPATVNADDLLLMAFASLDDITTPSGWTQINSALSGSDTYLHLLGKVADGTEDSTTVTVTTDGPSTSDTAVYRIQAGTYHTIGSDWASSVPSVNVTSAGNLDPYELATGIPSQTNLWLALATTYDADGLFSITAAPTDYTADVLPGTIKTKLAAANRKREIATEDPGAFTDDEVASVTFAAITAAVHPPYTLAPDELSVSPFMWFDASETTSMWADTSRTTQATDGSVVQAWDDLSGNARHVENGSASSSDIVLDTDGFNTSYPCVSFLDTALGYLDTLTTMSLGANDFTIIWVGKYTGVTGEHSYFLGKQNANLHVYAAAERFGGDGLGWFAGSHNGFGGSLASTDDIYAWDLDSSGNYKGFQQTSQIGSTVTGVSFSTSVDELRIGGASVSDFIVSEMIVYPSRVPIGEYEALIGHLKSKWGK